MVVKVEEYPVALLLTETWWVLRARRQRFGGRRLIGLHTWHQLLAGGQVAG